MLKKFTLALLCALSMNITQAQMPEIAEKDKVESASFFDDANPSTIKPLEKRFEKSISIDQIQSIKLAKPQEVNIAKHQASIARIIKWNKVARYGVKAGSVAAGIGMIYMLLRSKNPKNDASSPAASQTPASTVPAPVAVQPQPVIPAPQNPQFNPDGFKHVADKISRIENSLSPKFFSWQWFKNTGTIIGEHMIYGLVATKIFSSFENYLNEKVFHSGSVGWFVHARTKVMTTFEEIRQYVSSLESGKADNEMPRFFIISACNSLVADLEMVIGFMEYKQTTLKDASQAQEAAAACRYAFNATNKFCMSLDEQLKSDTMNGNKIETLFNDFKNEIGRILVSFSRIENQNIG